MYLQHYGLDIMPFEIGPDPRFLWLGSKHKEPYAVLRYGILESKGYVVIVGEPGMGKSTLLNATIAAFDSGVRFVRINDPALSTTDFFQFAADALGMGQEFRSKGEFLVRLRHFIQETNPRKVILVIDEAQRIPAEMLEQIRVFTDADDPARKVFSCVFAGQPEFLDTIRQNRPLSQRIFFSHTIEPLSASETVEYIAHRLSVAGCKKPLFTGAAIQEIHRLSKGVPRLINVLCDQGLLAGYATIQKKIGPELIRECMESTRIPLQTVSAADPAMTDSAPNPLAPAAPAAAAAIPEQVVSAAQQPARRRPYALALALLLAAGLVAFGYFLHRQAPAATATELMRERDAAVSRARELQAALATLQAELRPLQDAGKRLSESEQTLAQRDVMMAELKQKLELSGSGASSASKQLEALQKENSRLQSQLAEVASQKNAAEARLAEQAAKLQTALDRTAEHNKEQLQREVVLAELRQKLETSGAGQSAASKQLDTLQKENARLLAQLTEAASLRGGLERRLAEQQKANEALAADVKAMKGTAEKAGLLQAALIERERKAVLAERAASELEKALVQEKAAAATQRTEAEAQKSATAELRKVAEELRARQAGLEAELRTVRSENARLQALGRDASARPPASVAPASAPASAQTVAPPPAAPAAAGPDPAGAIDYVLKRRAP